MGTPLGGAHKESQAGCRALSLGLAHPNLIREILSSFPGLRESSLNFTLDVDVVKQRKRLQCPDRRTCQSYLRKWSSESRLCEPLLLIPTEGEVSGGVLKRVQRVLCC